MEVDTPTLWSIGWVKQKKPPQAQTGAATTVMASAASNADRPEKLLIRCVGALFTAASLWRSLGLLSILDGLGWSSANGDKQTQGEQAQRCRTAHCATAWLRLALR